jgi:hypothetical protein
MAKEKARRLPILAELGFPTHDESVALDRRDIGRGSVYAEELARAREAGYLPLRTVKALNALWAERASLRQGSVERVGDFGHRVISALKHDVKRQDAPLWALCNLSGETQTVSVEVSELRQKMFAAGSGPFALRDVLAARRDGGPGEVIRLEGERLSLTLEPHAHLLLEATSR